MTPYQINWRELGLGFFTLVFFVYVVATADGTCSGPPQSRDWIGTGLLVSIMAFAWAGFIDNTIELVKGLLWKRRTRS